MKGTVCTGPGFSGSASALQPAGVRAARDSNESVRRVLFVDRHKALAIWSVLAPVAKALQDRRWEAGFVYMADEDEETSMPLVPGCEAFAVNVPGKRWPGDLVCQQLAFQRGFADILRRVQPDVVHVNFAIPGIWARRAAKRMGVPIVVSTQHEVWESMSWHLRVGLAATRRFVDVHTYVSETVARSFGAMAELNTANVENALPGHAVIRNGVDEAAIRSVVNAGERIPGRIVAAGRLVPEKRHGLILEAFERIRRHFPDAELLIVGSGPEEPRLLRMAQRLGVADAVRFPGWLPREELWAVMASAGLAVFASGPTQEGFGLALAEAALLGVPLVVSRIGAFGEVLAGDAQAAWWFDPLDADSLAGMLTQAMSAPNDERCRRSSRARRAAERHSTQAMVEGYVALYQRVDEQLGGHRSG